MLKAKKFKRATMSEYRDDRKKFWCMVCRTNRYTRQIMIPYALRYLAAELLSANVRMIFRTDGHVNHQQWDEEADDADFKRRLQLLMDATTPADVKAEEDIKFDAKPAWSKAAGAAPARRAAPTIDVKPKTAADESDDDSVADITGQQWPTSATSLPSAAIDWQYIR